MCVKLLIERHIKCAQSSRESKGKLIRSMDCKLSDLGVMLSLFVELWFKFLDVGLFQSMSLCRIFNIEERRAEKEWFSKFTIFSKYAMFEMLLTIQGIFLRISDVLLMVVHSCSAVFSFAFVLL